MQDTKTHPGVSVARAGRDAAWLLTVAYHPQVAQIGARTPLSARRPLELGRAARSGLGSALDADGVSRQHARVTLAGERVSVEDLGSRNGTRVNGVAVERATLEDGDVLGLGSVLLLVHRAPPSYEAIEGGALVGVSAGLRGVLADVERVAERDTTVVVIGETGVGKELVAREIHARSGRSGALVALNCGGLADTLVQSELFGHSRGAFTGATERRPGLIERAAGGTLFLDEVTDASPALQATLLRVLETRRFRPVGADTERETDARIVVACQPDVEARLEDGRFRRDLWTRLARWVIEVPPLRARRDDIPLLALHFARRFSARGGELGVSPELMLVLLRHGWPGNVRELSGVMERLVISSPAGAALEVQDWLLDLTEVAEEHTPETAAAPAKAKKGGRRRGPTQAPPRAELEAALRANEGNVSAVADAFGVGRRTVYRWLDGLGLDPWSFR